jgi:hypothetical protein
MFHYILYIYCSIQRKKIKTYPIRPTPVFFSSSMNYYISVPFYNLWDTCHKHLPVLSSFITYHRVCNKINTTGATSGAGTAYPSGAPEFISVFSGVVRVNRSFVLCVCFVDRCLSFCTFSLGHCVVCSSIYRF